MKRALFETAIILSISVLIGIFYNFSNPSKLPFIGSEQKIDFSQSDSLLLSLRRQDSLSRIADSVGKLSDRYSDSLKIVHEKFKDSIKLVKQDSLKRLKDSLEVIKKNDSSKTVSYVKPVDIKINFAKALFDKQYVFIDARDPSDFSAGHIKNAVNIPFHNINDYRKKLESMKKDDVYVCYCSSACDVSIDLAYYMAKMGFTKLYIFHGGWDEWKSAGYPEGS